MNFEERVLARMTTGIENRDPHALAMLERLEPGHARIVGITGPPGAGKSTLVDALARELRQQGKTVAILAVDPTSRRTGGALLGDRIRMQQHYSDPGIFIRSMATRGQSGGIARATADVARLMDRAGKDYVLIETVGVGQDEIAVAALADITVVVLVPGMGDDVQAIKAGIMEIADIFVINKSDREGADRVEREVRSMQSLAVRSDKWTPPIIKSVATTAQGIPELAAAIADYERYLKKTNLLLKKKITNWHDRLIEMLRDSLLERLLSERLPEAEIARLAADVAEHRRDPYSLVDEIVSSFTGRAVST
jgi:LAO/AO transport system kinase